MPYNCLPVLGSMWRVKDAIILGLQLVPPLTSRTPFQRRFKSGLKNNNVKRLSKIAETQPHAAYCAFTHGLSSRWLFICRTVLGIFPSVDNVICQVFIPTITGRHLHLSRCISCSYSQLAGVVSAYLNPLLSVTPSLLLSLISASSFATLLLIVFSPLLRFLLLNCIENLWLVSLRLRCTLLCLHLCVKTLMHLYSVLWTLPQLKEPLAG